MTPAVAQLRTHVPSAGRLHEALTAGFVLLWYILLLGFVHRSSLALDVVNVTYFVIGLLAVWAMHAVAKHPAIDARTARAWNLLAWSGLAIVVSGVAWTVFVLRHPGEVSPDWSTVADAAYVPLAVAAFATFPRHPLSIYRRPEVALDGALLFVGTMALAWYFSLRPTLATSPSEASVRMWVEALGSVAVVIAACDAYLRATNRRMREAIALALLAQVVYVVSGFVLGPSEAPYRPGDLVDGVFFAAWVFRWLAARWAWHSLAHADGSQSIGERAARSGTAPAAFVSGAFAMLVWAVFSRQSTDLGNPTIIATVALAMTWLLVARHALHLVETRRQLQALGVQKERFRAVMDSVSDYVFATDATGEVTWASESALRGIGLQPMVRLTDRVSSDDDARLRAWLHDTAASAATRPAVTVRLQRVDGAWAQVELRGQNRLDDSAIGALVINGRDRSSEVALEGRVRHAEKLATLHDMAGRIAHAFNNVLAVVHGHAELLAADATLSAEWHGDISEMRTAANRGASITRQLLGFSGRQVTYAEAVDVAGVVEEALPGWRRLLPAGTTVELTRDANVPRAYVDRAQLEQVLLNLVVNARDAMPGGGMIAVRVRRGDSTERTRRVVVAVSDSGIGISDEQQARIFEPFFTTKAPGVGTGLGLAMVDTIVRRAGGEIVVSSTVGKGATFTVTLPAAAMGRASGAVAVQTDAADPGVPVSRAAVLLVDDEDAVRHVAARILSRAGFDVEARSNGADALEALRHAARPFDVLVTDMMMPGMSGRELIQQVVPDYPNLPIIVITGFAADADTGAQFPPQVERVIEKPFEAADLIGAVRRAAAGSGS